MTMDIRWKGGGGDIVIIDYYEPNGSDNPPANPTNPDEDEGFFLPVEGTYSARDPTTDGGEDATNSDTTTDIEPFDP